MKVIRSVDDALALIGEELGVSRWVDIDQSRIDAFADVTMDHQWIHVDVEGQDQPTARPSRLASSPSR